VGIAGDLKGEIYRIYVGDNKLGRAQTCDVHLLDARISREHATVLCEEGANAIIPHVDKNPVYLNEEVVDEAAELSDGDAFQLGNPGSSVFRFRTIEGL
jgi:pSer/pThr/pTyr-binding forkhead associated (FHA) protein